MTTDPMRQRIERLLTEADEAVIGLDWITVRARVQAVLTLDPGNEDASALLTASERGLQSEPPTPSAVQRQNGQPPEEAARAQPVAPTSFANGRYAVKKFLGEGGKKKVYLAHDTLLDRDVAFALIKTEELDDIGRDRITREAQAMGRLGAHPHIVSVFDLGEEDGQPYIVTELMGGGDVEGLIEKAPEHRPPLERALEIGMQVCRGLEFAHDHGIVHRDLKPGNVWLTADGTAKLGDFGLAIALDRSRLTQAGMMVGTVSYMPPEQAMGGEVTPRSDLYSLGAMLYEMVTGRPPFVGDETVAIIGQHLNAPPVAPTWHNPTVPSGLEALILRLLEKDPSKRPTSAAEVREALVHVAPSAPVTSDNGGTNGASASTDMTENPLYRRVFVGREQEVRQLRGAFDGALSGMGALAMVVGEPGIGKTAVCEQLATYVTLRGGTTLTGHCYEEGSLSLPYLAFIEALRSYAASRPPDALRKELGSAATDVARIVSEVRERLSIEPRPTGDPEEDRWRLLQAVSGFLRNASTVQPLLLILEDLHWADRGTLDLLLHLARILSGARLLVIGTYRDVEVDRSHPLSATLAELRRGAEFGRVLLRGLGTPEVQRMLVAITDAEVPGSLAESIHRQTEGNPLFVQEVVRYMVEEGHLAHGASGATAVGMAIPEGLRDVIGKRLSRLSPECNRYLSIAAVIGRDFTLTTLQSISGRPREELADALAEAVHTAVLTEEERVGEVRYRFAHAFFRQTLYEELGAARRIQFHQQVARALESQYAGRLGEHAAELAEHFAHSSDRADLTKAVQYAQVAADRAMSVYAYGEAVRHLEQALDVQEVLDPDDQTKSCDLLLALGSALMPAGEPLQAAEKVAPRALELAEALKDSRRASLACLLALEGLNRYGSAAMQGTSVYRNWAELAARYVAPRTAERAIADQALGRIEFTLGRASEGIALMRQALDLARELGDASLYFQTAGPLLLSATPESLDETRLLAEEVAAHSRQGASAFWVGQALWHAGSTLLSNGERERWESLWEEVAAIGERSRDPAFGLLARQMWLATLDGRLEDALVARTDALSRADEFGVAAAGQVFGNVAAFHARLYLGRAGEHLEVPWAADRMQVPMPAAARALCLAHLGRRDEAVGLVRDVLSERIFGPDAAGASTRMLVYLLETAILIEDRPLTESLARRLEPLATVGSSSGSAATPTCIGRHLGAAAALLGDRKGAHRYYEQALDLATRIRHRPEIALTHLGLAELLLDDADEAQRAAALQHLDFAINEFREMKMQPSLERALRHKEVLKA